jgi:hypothetical protein
MIPSLSAQEPSTLHRGPRHRDGVKPVLILGSQSLGHRALRATSAWFQLVTIALCVLETQQCQT